METTLDAFLEGRVMLRQPKKGYRAGVDAVLLAAACPAVAGESVLDLGCGVGAASLCLAARVPGLALVGVERQAEMADLARQNAADTGIEIWTGDIAALPHDLRQRSFHHVIANPPYFPRDASVRSTSSVREEAMGEDTPLELWLDCAARRLRPGGRLTMIHRADRLPDILAGLAGRLGSVVVKPLAPRIHRPARLVLVAAQKDGRAPFCLAPPLVMHKGDRHLSDAEDYTPEVAAILRKGAALPLLDD